VKQWLVKTPDSTISVMADRVFYDEGYVKFFNNKSLGQQWGATIALFAPGQWLYVNSAAEGSA
jgi:hypothetical protein